MKLIKGPQVKLVLYFVMIVVIPLIILYFFMYDNFRRFSFDKAVDASFYDTRIVGYSVDQLMKKVDDLSMQIFSDTELTGWIMDYSSLTGEESRGLARQKIDTRLYEYISANNELHSIYVYDFYENMFKQFYKMDLNSALSPPNEDYFNYSQKFREVFRMDGKSLTFFSFIDDQKKSLSSARLLKNIYNGKPIGFLILNINQEVMKNYIKNSSSEMLLLDEAGNLVSSNDRHFIDPLLFRKKYFKSIQEQFSRPGAATRQMQLPGAVPPSSSDSRGPAEAAVQFVAIGNHSPSTGLYTVNITPLAGIYSQLMNFRYLITAAALLCILYIIIIMAFFSFKIFIPVFQLKKAMKSVESGCLDIQLAQKKRDEFGDLFKSFNKMVSMLKVSFENRLEQEEMKKRAELAALQAQINPHFLYNTLNSVKWLADMHNVPNVSQLITSLVKLIRHTIGKGGEYITVREEIENIRNYEYIEKIRFGDKFSIDYQINESVNRYLILKLLLQPIIENSIFHGFKELDAGGLITVLAYEDGQDIVFEISDNGVGIREEEIDGLLDSHETNKNAMSSIGIRNIDQRLKLNFGTAYGIKIRSSPDNGVKVTLRTPKIEDTGS